MARVSGLRARLLRGWKRGRSANESSVLLPRCQFVKGLECRQYLEETNKTKERKVRKPKSVILPSNVISSPASLERMAMTKQRRQIQQKEARKKRPKTKDQSAKMRAHSTEKGKTEKRKVWDIQGKMAEGMCQTGIIVSDICYTIPDESRLQAKSRDDRS